MVEVKVETGKVSTRIAKKKDDPPIQEEVVAAVSALLAGYQAELIHKGISPVQAEYEFFKIMHAIHVGNTAHVRDCLAAKNTQNHSIC